MKTPMTLRQSMFAILIGMTLWPGPAASTPSDTFDAYLKALNQEDGDAALAAIHSESPFFLQSLQMMRQVFPVYDIRTTATGFDMLGTKGGERFATVEQHFIKDSGPAFQNNRQDAVVVFREEDGRWKIWGILPFDGGPVN